MSFLKCSRTFSSLRSQIIVCFAEARSCSRLTSTRDDGVSQGVWVSAERASLYLSQKESRSLARQELCLLPRMTTFALLTLSASQKEEE